MPYRITTPEEFVTLLSDPNNFRQMATELAEKSPAPKFDFDPQQVRETFAQPQPQVGPAESTFGGLAPPQTDAALQGQVEQAVQNQKLSSGLAGVGAGILNQPQQQQPARPVSVGQKINAQPVQIPGPPQRDPMQTLLGMLAQRR